MSNNILNRSVEHISEKYDSLTGLLKYDYFVSNLKAIINFNRGNTDFALAIVYSDFNYFQYLNETYGYTTGDNLLNMYSNYISSDSPIYLGGCRVYSDNFVMVINIAKIPSVDLFCKHVNNSVALFEEQLQSYLFDCQISLNTGVYIMKDTFNEDIETAIGNANFARKEAKKRDSHECVLFTDDMMQSIIRNIELSSSFPMAIESRELQVFYQPKIDCETLSCNGAEALIRWLKPDGTYIYPDQFIPLFEKNGLIVELDYYVYEEVFKFLQDSLQKGHHLVPISMNVSRAHFDRSGEEIGLFIEQLINTYNIPTEYIEFELTESIYIDKIDKVIPFVEKMHSLGIKISMDDFGSGYSSLNLLTDLPIDILKLDKVFLAKDQLTKNQKIIISSVISMAQQLKIKVLCEGVERRDQIEFLKEVGCNTFQGFYFSRPICKQDFEVFLSEEHS